MPTRLIYEQMAAYYADIIDDSFNDYLYTSKPERKEEIYALISRLIDSFEKKEVLELAAGAGFWTDKLARVAKSVVAVDKNIEILQRMESDKVKVHQMDLLNMKDELVGYGKFDGIFASCWISHVLRQDMNKFLKCLLPYVRPDGIICFIESIQYPGAIETHRYGMESSMVGNQYQFRTLKNGTRVETIKNYYSLLEWCELIERSGIGKIIEYKEFVHYFIMKLRVN